MDKKSLEIIADAIKKQSFEINRIENNQDRWKAQDVMGSFINKIKSSLSEDDAEYLNKSYMSRD